MDKHKLEYDKLIEFINGEICFQTPLFHNNPGHTIRFDFEDISDDETRKTIKDILSYLFRKKSFWVCDLGTSTAHTIYSAGLFLPPYPPAYLIPYKFLSDIYDGYFEYEEECIVCCRAQYNHFNQTAYLNYVHRLYCSSNEIYLVNEIEGTVVHVYDRRGMDVFSLNSGVLIEMSLVFHCYLSKYWKNNII